MISAWLPVLCLALTGIGSVVSLCGDHCLLSTNATIPTCNETTGECLLGCEKDFTGPSCNYTCTYNCFNCTLDSTADPAVSVCEECDPNFYRTSSKCEPCSPRCQTNASSETPTCADTTGYCNFGCVTGDHCLTNTTIPTCNETTGECLLGCKKDYTGPYCDYTCGGNCFNCTIDSTADPAVSVCEECDSNFYLTSSKCESCSSQCQTNASSETPRCDKNTGYCNFGCVTGDHCIGSTSSTISTCNETTGECLLGCEKDYTGPYCDYKCTYNCFNCTLHSTADPPVSVCEECDSNFYRTASKCVSCSSRCRANASSETPKCADNTGYCNFGCITGFFDNTCNRPCSAACQDRLCERVTGNCIGCQGRKRYGTKCGTLCQPGCATDTCDQAGVCDDGCDDLFYGDTCSDQCPTACNPCTESARRCNESNGQCTCGCRSVTTHGPQCGNQCPATCIDSECDQLTGDCVRGCGDGYYGQKCDLQCNVNCLHEKCFHQNGTCEEGCVAGYYDLQCTQPCTGNCLNSTCHRHDRTCIHGCENSWFGDMCAKQCSPGCLNGTCDRDSGSCVNGCENKWSGDQCTLPCNTNCLDGTCHRGNGTCFLGCKNTWHGDFCTSKCNTNCVNVTCRRENGTCIHGCENSWYGDICTKRCSPGCLHGTCDRDTGSCVNSCENQWYGDQCTLTCNINCLDGTCHRGNGRCFLGCKNTWHGGFCTSKCNTNCVNATCRREDGTCIHGCLSGFTGDSCDEKTTELAVTSIIGIGCGCAVALAILVTIAVVTRKRVAKRNEEIREEKRKSRALSSYMDLDAPVSRRHRTAGRKFRDTVVSVMEIVNPEYGRRRRRNADIPLDDEDGSAKTTRVLVEELLQQVTDMDSSEYTEEFGILDKRPCKPTESSKQLAACTQNCYGSIVPYDDSRVVLKVGPTEGDYINASWIKGIDGKNRYIAAQGPTKTTKSQFWRMVWQVDSSCIVMLSVIGDEGSSGDNYWPDVVATCRYGDVDVKTTEESVYADYKVRRLQVSKNEEVREVRQLCFTRWPRKGMPRAAGAMLGFYNTYRAVVERAQPDSGPIVVHCTAGVGRTGFFIALDQLVADGRRDGVVDVLTRVKVLREQRMQMVQTANQYEFLYKVVAQIPILEPYHENFLDTLADLLTTDRTGSSNLARIYEMIGDSLPLDISDIDSIFHNQAMPDKNRDDADSLDDAYRVMLLNDAYINAVYVDSHLQRRFLILTQAPTSNTVADFYRLVCQEQCRVIVMLNVGDPQDETLSQYWPQQTTLTHENIQVTMTNNQKRPNSVMRELTLTDVAEGGNDEHHVTMLQFTDWPSGQMTPDSRSSLVELVLEVQSTMAAEKSGRVLVHCLNGSERSGLFCVLYSVLEAIHTADGFSIAAAARKVKTVRPSAISTLAQFRYCYDAISSHLGCPEVTINNHRKTVAFVN